MPFPNAIITKPFLVSDSDYKDLGLNINLVGYDSFSQVAENTKQHVSPRLLNWVEPFEISGVRKTLFYTEVNTNFQVGDRVYIVNGNYDNDSLIKKDKYKKGRDGYKVLRVEQCKIVLDIDYTGALPNNDDSLDDYIKVYYIDNLESFVNANRQVTTRGGTFDYKFNYYQNNIAFIDNNFGITNGWGLNAGVSGAPGFFVREGKDGWSKITDDFVYLGSFSVALSPTYKNNGRILIMDGSFTYNGIQFKEGFVYSWNVGPTSSSWQVDVSYSPSIITKSNFRNGTFNGKFNNGLYGTQQNKLDWSGKGTWNGGSMLNTLWKSGTIDSKFNFTNTYRSTFDEYGIPFQKSYTANNGGFGYNYIFDSEVEKSLVNNGNFYNTIFNQKSATFSVVENHILSITQSFENRIVKAHFDFCNFVNTQIDGGELKNVRSKNSKFSNVKSINSYFDKSVLKDSTYISDKLIKILGYDEWNMSEYKTLESGQFSSIKDVNSKIYKFYISKENYKRLKTEDVFYIKGLKIKNSPTLTDFFDSKFKLSSWTEFYDDMNSTLRSGSLEYFFYKRGYESSAFLSTPEENAYIINSYESLYNVSGSTVSKYTTTLSGKNPNAGYSIDIIVSRHDLYNKNRSIDQTSEWDSLNPKDFNYSNDVVVGTTSLPTFLGSNIDITDAYILDSDFNSGVIETSDWNSGYHINYNNDVVITSITSSGLYSLEIDNDNDYLIATTNLNTSYPEKIGKYVIEKDDIVFLNSIDYDTTGMVTQLTIISAGSSYSTTTDPVYLVNTKVESLTMSSTGSYYKTATNLETSTNGNGTGLTLDITADPIGSVLAITFSAPMSGGGSYSMNLFSSVSTTTGPLGTSFSAGASPSAILPGSYTGAILTDDALGTVTGITQVQNGGVNATYSVFGPPLTTLPSGATGVGVIFLTGPLSVSNTGVTSSPSSLGSGLTLNYKTSANGAITSLSVNERGFGYDIGQVFKIEGGNATFSITSVSKGEITSYKINNPGEDYLKGDVLDIINPFDPNFQFGTGLTASVIVTSITVSNLDTRGLSLEFTTGSGATEGQVFGLTISTPGLYYKEGEIFTINDGNSNLDALVRVDSVTGSVTRLNDTYKVINNEVGVLTLKDLGKQNIIAGLTAYGAFYTTNALNRWGYISKTKIDKTKIKSGIFKRPYIVNSLIRDIDYDSTDMNFVNKTKIKNLIISDTLFSNNSNILSSATYLYSNIVGGNDIWNDGIINKSIINGLTFSKGTVRQASWIDGNFTGGMFYYSKSFDAQPTLDRPNYLNNRVRSYYVTGEIGPTLSNNRYSWRNGKFSGGQFYKSDWEDGSFNNGLFYYSKFYNGAINGGKIGTNAVAAADTRIYNGLINYTTVDNASVYSEDTSYTGLSSSNITWINGVFNNGIFGSNNTDILGTTVSNISYLGSFSSIPIADFKITTYTQNVTDTNPILGNFEIDVTLDLKHTYLGDLIISLMAPNGKIINLKTRYSCGSNDNLTSTIFTSDSSKPSIEIGTPPYTGEFKFSAQLNQGVYYDLNNRLLPGIAYNATQNIIADVIDYRSFPPTPTYESDRYLVIATASDPNWTTSSSTAWPVGFVGNIVEKSASGNWELYSPKNNDLLFIKSKSEYLKYIDTTSFKGWVKSYHSNVTKITDLLNNDKTITGNWKLMVMDVASLDSGFLEKFDLNFTYKTSYIIKSFKNNATWYNGIFNGGQFIDLGVWKNGKFNGGKFISTYGYKQSGNYLEPSDNIDEYSWQAGEFNGGEFGNESLLSNSTWYDGEFNGGTFKGKLWNNGVFTYGEFKGGASVPAIGNGIKSANAQTFVDSYKTEYYGVWRKGVVSDKKDNFVLDKKIFTAPVRAMAPVKLGKTAKFSNMLWVSGTFDHPSGEINNSVWLNGLFKMGNFKTSAFNPYVKRNSDIQEFVKDDSCIWENGKLIDSEFHMSKWKYGHFISGTAVGMIWQNGIADYMNAYNIFWENGVWRNGNWYGSNFEYRGYVEDGFSKEILNRGIEWSGTSSCHIWNLFESDVDTTFPISTTAILKDTTVGGDSFTTTNSDDAGYGNPSVSDVPVSGFVLTSNAQNANVTFTISSNGGDTILEAGIIYIESTTQTLANNARPAMSVSSSSGVPNSGTSIKKAVGSVAALGSTVFTLTVQIPVVAGRFYTIQGYALNSVSNVDGPALSPGIAVFQTVQKNTITMTALPNTLTAGGEIYTGGPTSYTQGYRNTITINANWGTTNTQTPAPTEYGIIYSTTIQALDINNGTKINNSTVGNLATTSGGGAFTAKILAANVAANQVYYIMAYAKNLAGEAYGPLLTITSGVGNPTLTISIDPPSPNETDLIGNITDMNGSTSLKRGFVIAKISNNININTLPSTLLTNGNPNTARMRFDFSTDAAATGNFTQLISGITGLTPGDTYYARAFAYNLTYTNVFAYSSLIQFKAAASVPNVSSLAATPIASTTATLKGTIVSNSGSTITGSGFVYTTNTGSYPTTPSSATLPAVNVTNAAISGNFNNPVTGLATGTTYYFKPYATNGVGTGYSTTEQTFTTLAEISANLTPGTTDITPAFTVNNAGSSTITARGIIWSSTSGTGLTTASSTKTTDGPGTTTAATGLIENTLYYVVAYITNAGGTYYSSPVQQITTKPAFVASGVTNNIINVSSTALNITTSALSGSATVILGNQPFTRGIEYGIHPGFGTKQATTSSGATSYVTAIGGVTPLAKGTKYAYKPYVENSSGTTYATDGVFTTLVDVTLPTTTPFANWITYASGNINIGTGGEPINITNTGLSNITSYGLCYNIDALGNVLPTSSDTTVTGSATNPTNFFMSIPITLPSTGTDTYRIRAYVINDGGSAYSLTIRFTIDSTGLLGTITIS